MSIPLNTLQRIWYNINLTDTPIKQSESTDISYLWFLYTTMVGIGPKSYNHKNYEPSSTTEQWIPNVKMEVKGLQFMQQFQGSTQHWIWNMIFLFGSFEFRIGNRIGILAVSIFQPCQIPMMWNMTTCLMGRQYCRW